MEEKDPDTIIVLEADVRYEVNEWMNAVFVIPLNKVIEDVVINKEFSVDVVKFRLYIYEASNASKSVAYDIKVPVEILDAKTCGLEIINVK